MKQEARHTSSKHVRLCSIGSRCSAKSIREALTYRPDLEISPYRNRVITSRMIQGNSPNEPGTTNERNTGAASDAAVDLRLLDFALHLCCGKTRRRRSTKQGTEIRR